MEKFNTSTDNLLQVFKGTIVCLNQSFVIPYFLKFLLVAPRHLMSFFPSFLHPRQATCTWLRTAAVQFSNQPQDFSTRRW